MLRCGGYTHLLLSVVIIPTLGLALGLVKCLILQCFFSTDENIPAVWKLNWIITKWIMVENTRIIICQHGFLLIRYSFINHCPNKEGI